MAVRILRNAAQCLHCKDIIESKHRHDFVKCSCFKNKETEHGICVDGGLDYLRCIAINVSEFKSLIITEGEPEPRKGFNYEREGRQGSEDTVAFGAIDKHVCRRCSNCGSELSP